MISRETWKNTYRTPCPSLFLWVAYNRYVLEHLQTHSRYDLGFVHIYGPMMTSSNGKIFLVTGPLLGEPIGHRWTPFTKRVTRRFGVFCAWTNYWSTNQDASDLWRHHAHYNVTVVPHFDFTYLDRPRLFIFPFEVIILLSSVYSFCIRRCKYNISLTCLTWTN